MTDCSPSANNGEGHGTMGDGKEEECPALSSHKSQKNHINHNTEKSEIETRK